MTEQQKKEEKPKKKIKLYKKLLIIPLLLLILSIAQISYQTATTGDFVKKDYSLTGGVEVSAQTTQEIDTVILQEQLQQQFPTISEVRLLTRAGTTTGIAVTDTNLENAQEIKKSLQQELTVSSDEISIKAVGPTLATTFFKQTVRAILIAFLFMGFVVFLYFRIPIPSMAVILAAFSDIIITLAIFNTLGFELSTAGIAAFLMLIGYSVDTDILLSTRLLKRREGTIKERLRNAMRTGILMNITTLTAITVALIVSQSPIIKQIMTILMIGLLVDMVNTWIQNAGILRWYMEKKHNG